MNRTNASVQAKRIILGKERRNIRVKGGLEGNRGEEESEYQEINTFSSTSFPV